MLFGTAAVRRGGDAAGACSADAGADAGPSGSDADAGADACSADADAGPANAGADAFSADAGADPGGKRRAGPCDGDRGNGDAATEGGPSAHEDCHGFLLLCWRAGAFARLP